MISVEYRKGVYLPASDFWLDPGFPAAHAFVSHAHSDHTGRHQRTLCTPQTARLMQTRMSGDLGILETLGYGEKRSFGSWAAMLFPAGHVLGSAQLLYESDEGSLLYTGDFKLRQGLSSEGASAPPAETLIMETTFGLPRYQFPPAEQTMAAVVKFCHEALEDGEVPILLGYALGKAQEILSVLHGAGLPIMLHGAVWNIAKVYEEFGIQFPAHEKYDPEHVAGHVVICPPNVNGSRMLSKIKKRRVAVLTGWALDTGAVHRLQVDAAFPLSDHADYNELLKLVEMVQPQRVLTLHGFAQEFARDLRARGIEAWALTGANQLELTLAGASPVREMAPPAPLAETGFDRFCQVCEAIRQTTGKLEKIRLLADYLRPLDPDDLARAAIWLTGHAFPPHDEKPVNAGWSVIHRAIGAASGLSLTELKAISRRHNDSGLTAAEAMSHRPGEGLLTLAEVHGLFRELQTARGPIIKTEILTETFRRIRPAAVSYLVRILTGDLRIGLKEGLVEEAVAAAFEREADLVREANMLLGDLGRAAQLAQENSLSAAELTTFCPIKCMLASPEPDAEGIWSRLGEGCGRVWLEDKLDGIRAQIHCTTERVEIYSRDLKKITATFPEIAQAALRLRRPAVFDGEILAWENGVALSFFELQKRLGRRESGDLFISSDIPVAFLIFDILQLDGRSLLKKPLTERRSMLDRLPLNEILKPAVVHTARSPEEIDDAFRAARQRGNEGLIAKDPTSLYSPGRRGLSWLKLKKEFATLDVVVVAAEYGHGRRSKVLSDYTFAVRDEKTGALLPIGKAYSGLTDVEIEELTEEFLTITIDRKGNRLEVEPRVVLEIAFDSLQASDRHASGLAMRFPRIKQIRKDKTLADIDTLAVARKLAGVK